MLTVRNGNVFAFVPSDAQRDENERNGVQMYDYDPFNGNAELAFDGGQWLVPKMSVDPEP